jgi:16S rRNA (guanine527-N7)-methyltransferase
MNNNLVYEGCKSFGVELSQKQIMQFNRYKELLLEWNEKINLTAIEDEREIDIKHFIDSVSCVTSGAFKGNEKTIDVGTGAGFPGIPLKIVFPNLKLTLLDSLNKRINFLKTVSEELGLGTIEFIHGRAEDFGSNPKHRENYDIVMARAVANLSTLSEYCLPFLSVGGKFICQKGPKTEEEIQDAKRAVEILGGSIKEVKRVNLYQSDLNHTLIIIDKINNTPKQYPRQAGKPTKNPIR